MSATLPPDTLRDPESLAFLRGYIGMLITDIDQASDGTIVFKLHPPGRRATRWIGLWSARHISGFEVREGSRLLEQLDAAKRDRAEGRNP